MILRFISLIIFLFVTIIAFDTNIEKVSALEDQSINLIKKISKDYTKKYCNSIAFGLSKESAMRFSLEENKKVFEKRKGINSINKDLLAEEIANSVIENCGYPLNLSGEKGIQEFKNFYLLEENISSSRTNNVK